MLSAGSINSPQLLELSGIGDSAHLEAAGIQPVNHLPGVGANLSDHLNVRITYECTRPITINDLFRTKWRGARA